MNNIIAAINNHNYLQFHYDGHLRKVIPYAYGSHATTGAMVMRGLQVAGSSKSGKFDFPKLWNVNEMSGVQVLEEVFEIPQGYRKGDEHISPIAVEL